MNFESALAYMQGLHRFGIKLGNARFEVLLDRIGNPHREYAVAHVTGTKGKGSTTVMIATILEAHGFRVGSYFSPFVYDVTERVQVDSRPIPREDFARLVSEIRPHIEDLAESEYGQTTEFELKTAIGFKYFQERKVDLAAIEVGIGGRLDATNVVSPLVSVITNVGLDHTQILGDTIAKIAYEKAGIIKGGAPCITAADSEEALAVIRKVASERNAPLKVVADMSAGSPHAEILWTESDAEFTVRSPRSEYKEVELGLRGRYQGANAACAVAAIEEIANSLEFSVRDDTLRAGLRKAYLPGRLEILCRNPLVIADGAHNGMAARVLAQELLRIPFRRLLLVIGMIGGHDPDDVLRSLGPLAHTIYATEPTWKKRIPVKTVALASRRYCTNVVEVVPPLKAAGMALRAAEKEDLVLITGSFYVVGDTPPAKLLENS